MKSSVPLLCLLLFYSLPAQAQLIKGIGLKGGPVSATQSWDLLGGHLPTESRWGMDLGVYIEAFDHPMFSVMAEMHYIQKGFSDPPPDMSEFPEGTGDPIIFTNRVDYLSIPVMVKLRYEADPISPYLIAGPRVEFLIDTEGGPVYMNANSIGFGVSVGNVYRNANSVGFGVSVGGGIEVPISSVVISGEVTYSPSFDDVYSSDFLTVSNESIQFLLGVRL